MSDSNTIWQSHVFHGEKAWYVSTIEREFETFEGTTTGFETLVWEWDAKEKKRGNIVHQAGGIADHQAICRSLIATGSEAQP